MFMFKCFVISVQVRPKYAHLCRAGLLGANPGVQHDTGSDNCGAVPCGEKSEEETAEVRSAD